MVNYSLYNWLVAKQVFGKNWDQIIVMVDLVAFSKCGDPFKKAWLNAVQIPDHMGLSARCEMFPFPDGYSDIGAQLSDE